MINSQDEVSLLRFHGINQGILEQRVQDYKAGNIQHYITAWRALTSDRHILDTVRDGLQLNFYGDPPEKEAFEYPRSKKEFDVIDLEIKSLLTKGVITRTIREDGDYFSKLFTILKKMVHKEPS